MHNANKMPNNHINAYSFSKKQPLFNNELKRLSQNDIKLSEIEGEENITEENDYSNSSIPNKNDTKSSNTLVSHKKQVYDSLKKKQSIDSLYKLSNNLEETKLIKAQE